MSSRLFERVEMVLEYLLPAILMFRKKNQCIIFNVFYKTLTP